MPKSYLTLEHGLYLSLELVLDLVNGVSICNDGPTASRDVFPGLIDLSQGTSSLG